MTILYDSPTDVQQDTARRVLEAPAPPRNKYPPKFRQGQRVEFRDSGKIFTGTISAVEQAPDKGAFHTVAKYRVVPDPRFVTYPRLIFSTQVLRIIDGLDDDMLSRGHRYIIMQHTDPERGRFCGAFYMISSSFLTKELNRYPCRVIQTLDDLDEAHNRMIELQQRRDRHVVYIEEYEFLHDFGIALPRMDFKRRLELEADRQANEQALARKQVALDLAVLR